MMGDNPDRIDMVASGECPDPKTATMADWSKWVEANYPYDPKWNSWLFRRLPHRRHPQGSKRELDDLRGIQDRSQAADFARLWFHLGTSEYERSFEANERFAKAKAAAEEKRRQEFEQSQESAPRAQFKRGKAQQWQE
jgi:hypothetical protein